MAKAGRQAGRGGGKGCAAERHQKAAPGSAWTAAAWVNYITQWQLDRLELLSAGSPYEPFAFIISTFIRLFVALIRFDARPACLLLSLSLSLYFHFIRFALTDPPTVSVHLANEDPSRMVTRAEGQNVTFKCRADARPPVTSYSWFKNVSRPALIPVPPLSPSR